MAADTEAADGNASPLGIQEAKLAARGFLALPDEAQTFLCLEGKLWLTREGVFEDYILGAGKRFTIRCGDSIVVQALRSSRVRLTAAGSAPRGTVR